MKRMRDGDEAAIAVEPAAAAGEVASVAASGASVDGGSDAEASVGVTGNAIDAGSAGTVSDS